MAQSRIALVIGVGKYQHVQALPNPPRDAQAIDAKLRSLGFATDLLIDPDRLAMEQAIRRFGDRARSADAALFYYAGHAFEVDGQNYIVPASAELRSIRDVPFETLSINLIPDQVQGRARVILMFLDACRDNPFLLRIADRGLMSRGLAPPSDTALGTLIAYATSPGRVAKDGNNDHSPFTAALLHWIDVPGLEVRQMLSRVRLDVREATQGQQIPWESSSLEGDFYFRPAVQPPAPTQAVQPDPTAPLAPLPNTPLPASEEHRPPPPEPAPTKPSPHPPPQSQIAMASRPIAKPPSLMPTPRPTPRPVQLPLKAYCKVPNFAGVTTVAGAYVEMQVINVGQSCNGHFNAAGQPEFPYFKLYVSHQPSHGKVDIEGGRFHYTPDRGFTGHDSFKLSTSAPDGRATFQVTVLPPTIAYFK